MWTVSYCGVEIVVNSTVLSGVVAVGKVAGLVYGSRSCCN